MTMTPIEIEAMNYGYCRCPNSPTRWYAGGPGVFELPIGEVHIETENDDRPVCFKARVYSSGKLFTVMRWTSFVEYMAYAERVGHKSEPGLPPFYNSHD